MNEIIPAVIPKNLHVVSDRLKKVLGAVKKVQMDIADGKYAPVVTWPFNKGEGDELLKMVRGEDRFPFIDDFILEVDMLCLHPIELIPDLLNIGIRSFVIHIDSTDHIKESIDTIKSFGAEVGIGIKPSLDTDLLKQYIISIDFVQFMGNDKVGYNGVALDPHVLEKIKAFNYENINTPIQIDIGVDFDTLPLLKKAGVSRFISGSTVFDSADPKQTIKILESL
jgi:ribulose-phosphate 3-epimerase